MLSWHTRAGRPRWTVLIPFVQLELPGEIGLADGRYLVAPDPPGSGPPDPPGSRAPGSEPPGSGPRGSAARAPGAPGTGEGGASASGERVLIVQALGAPRPRGRLSRRRPKPAGPAPGGSSVTGPVPVTRVTVAAGSRLSDREAAAAWIERACATPESRAAEVRSATRLINRAINAQRAGSGDPLVQDVGATRALAVRIGYGSGEQLAEGAFAEARELARPARGRLDGVDPQSRVAAVLGGRGEVHPAETLLLRARLDLQAGRLAEAAAQLRAAADALRRRPPGG